jgi:hypothetical protein
LIVALLELTYATSIRIFEIGVAVEGEAVLMKVSVVEVPNVVQDVVVHLDTVVVPAVLPAVKTIS